jgi:PAS domain S-box-containing protein
MQLDTKKLKKISVLYVEDDESVREQTLGLFERIFKKVFVAQDGIEGLKKFKENIPQIDIIVTDINMPNMNGLEMVRDINRIVPNIPIIVTTAHTDSEHLINAIDLNVDKYISKPVQVRDLTVAIVELVAKYKRLHNIESLAKTLVQKNNEDIVENEELKVKLDHQEKMIEHYKMIIDSLVFTMETDKLGVIKSASKKLLTFFDYSQSELLGKNISQLKCTTCNGNSFQQLMLKSVHTKKTIVSEHTLVTGNGQKVSFDVAMTPIYGRDSFVSGYTFYMDLISTQ